MATFTETTITGPLTEKKYDTAGIITKQAALNSDVIFSCANHGLVANQPIVFTASTGTNLGGNALLPANIIAGTVYYVRPGWASGAQHILTGVENNFQVSATPGGTEILWGSGFQGSVASPGHTFQVDVSSVASLLPQLGANTAYGLLFSSGENHNTAVYNITSGKVVVAYIDAAGQGDIGKAVVGSTSNVVHPGCSYSSGSTSLTISGGSNLLWAGFKVSGTGIPAGTTIASTGPFVLSAAATQTVSSGSLTFENNITGGVIWGTPVTFSDTTAVTTAGISMATLPGSSKVVIAWSEGSDSVSNVNNKGTSRVGTISDMAISFGAESTFEASTYGLPYRRQWSKCMVSDTTNNRVILAWFGFGPTYTAGDVRKGYASCGTVSGTTLTWSTPVAFNAGYISYEAAVYDATADKFVIAWESSISGAFGGRTIVGTVDGSNNITFGTVVVDSSYSWDTHAMTYHAAAGKIVHIFRKYGAPAGDDGGFARVGTISGTSITYGTENRFVYPSDMYDPNIIYHADAQKILLTWSSASGSPRTQHGIGGTVTGTTIALSNKILINDDNASTSTRDPGLAYDTVSKRIVITFNSTNGTKAQILHFDGKKLTVNLAIGNFFEVDLENVSRNITAITTSNPSATYDTSFVLKIIQGSTARQIEWSELSAFKWEAGTVPTLTTTNNAVDILSFTTYDNGTTWHGSVVGQNFS